VSKRERERETEEEEEEEKKEEWGEGEVENLSKKDEEHEISAGSEDFAN
jgi:hypothetical protein